MTLLKEPAEEITTRVVILPFDNGSDWPTSYPYQCGYNGGFEAGNASHVGEVTHVFTASRLIASVLKVFHIDHSVSHSVIFLAFSFR